MEKIIYRGVVFNKPDFDERKLYRSKTARAMLKGILIPQPCELCGDDEVHAHHEKYADYLSVRWLCPIHHKKIHSIFNKINRAENNHHAILKKLEEVPDSIMWNMFLKDTVKEIQDYYDMYINEAK